LNIKFNTKPYLPTLIASVLLFIMVFLPWLTVSAFGFSASANGMHEWGILTFIMSLVGAAAAFIAEKRTRALVSLLAGVLALLGVVIFMAANLGNGAGAGVGLILALIVSIVLIALAFMDFRNMPLPIKMSGPKASPPPPPPPAPPAPPAK
jgi:uncharacterized membrane protein (UPF0136 family)